MATLAPRIAVTVPPELYALITRLARHNDTSRSKIVGEILVEAAPVLVRVCDALDNVKRINEHKSEAIKATLEQAQAEAEKTAATALALLERIAAAPGPMDGPGRAQHGPGPARARTGRPPSANRGGKNRG